MGQKIIFMIMVGGWTLMTCGLPANAQEDVHELKQQIEALKKRVAELESIQTRPVVGVRHSRPNPAGTDADPFADMDRLQEEMDRIFQKSFSFSSQPGQGMLVTTMSFDAALDFKENEDGYVVTFNMSGLDQDKVDVQINEHSITVKGEQSQKKEQQNPNGYVQSQSYGSFMKTVPLPEDADVTQIKTEKEADRLVIKIPRKKL